VKVRESHEAARPLPFLAPKHKLSAQFEELYDEVEARGVGS
jgi:chromosome partitioning protein